MADPKTFSSVINDLAKKGTTYVPQNKAIATLPAISTGSILIDTLTGVGGMPKGRVVEIAGRESTGKCVTMDTLVATRRGWETLAEIRRTALTGEGDTESLNNVLVKGLGNKILAATHFYNAGMKPVYTFRTYDGHTLSGAETHRVLVVDPEGQITFKRLDELEFRDPVLIQTMHKTWNVTAAVIPKELANATIWGMLAGTSVKPDGTVLHVIDPDFQETALELLKQGSWEESEILSNDFSPVTGEIVFSEVIEDYIQQRQLRNGVPYEVRCGAQATQKAYLTGLVKTRGFWNDGKFELVIYSEKVAHQVQLLFDGLGIHLGWFETTDSDGNAEFKMYLKTLLDVQAMGTFLGDVKWQSDSAQVQEELLPFQEKNVADMVEYLKSRGVTGKLVEEKGKITRNYLQSLLGKLAGMEILRQAIPANIKTIKEVFRTLTSEDIHISEVLKKSVLPEAPMGDLVVPNVEHYNTAGIISHNSTLALTTALQAINQEGTVPKTVVYFDYEHATSESLVTKIGLPLNDPEKFLWLRPQSLEEGLEAFWALHDTGKLSMAIFDSYAAMTPQAVIDAQTDQDTYQIGLQSKLMSDFLNTVTKKASISQVLVVFTNQYRAKISMSGREGLYTKQMLTRMQVPEWFVPLEEDTAGGRALKYMCSMRIRMDLVKPIMIDTINEITGEKDRSPVGNIINITMIKNKIADPFKRGKATLEYGRGFDNVGILMQVAEYKGVINVARTGHFKITIPGQPEITGRGREELEKKLRSDNALVQKILASASILTKAKPELMFPSISSAIARASAELAAMPPETVTVDQLKAVVGEAE